MRERVRPQVTELVPSDVRVGGIELEEGGVGGIELAEGGVGGLSGSTVRTRSCRLTLKIRYWI